MGFLLANCDFKINVVCFFRTIFHYSHATFRSIVINSLCVCFSSRAIVVQRVIQSYTTIVAPGISRVSRI